MRILITGASGLIGNALANALERRGHAVVKAHRHPRGGAATSAIAVDFSESPGAAWWVPRLRGMDAVVNAAGIFRERGGQSFAAVHAQAPADLFCAASQAGVPMVVQISALGAHAGAETPFLRSKHQADEQLRQLPVRSAIVQPSLVFHPQGVSATAFGQWALMPVLVVPQVRAPLQPVHLDDLVDALIALLERPPLERTVTVAAVGPEPLTLQEYLLSLRNALGVRSRPLRIEIPLAWCLSAARLAAALVPALRHAPDAMRMLAQGNHADPAAFSRCLGRAPRPVLAFFAAQGSGDQARWHFQSQMLLAWMRLSIAAVWVVTAVVSLGPYPVAQSLELLQEFGLSGGPARAALYTGAVVDLALGLAVLMAPRRWSWAVWRAQLLVVVGYTVLITWRMPHWWLHPFGPVLKNLPLLVAIALMAAFDRKER